MIRVIERLQARSRVRGMDKLFVSKVILCIFLAAIGILWPLMISIASILAKALKVQNYIPRKSLDSHPKRAKIKIYSPKFKMYSPKLKITWLNPKFKANQQSPKFKATPTFIQPTELIELNNKINQVKQIPNKV